MLMYKYAKKKIFVHNKIHDENFVINSSNITDNKIFSFLKIVYSIKNIKSKKM